MFIWGEVCAFFVYCSVVLVFWLLLICFRCAFDLLFFGVLFLFSCLFFVLFILGVWFVMICCCLFLLECCLLVFVSCCVFLSVVRAF